MSTAEVASQVQPDSVIKNSDDTISSHKGHPPQKPGAKCPVNTARPDQTFYTPWTYPASGEALVEDDNALPKLFQPLTLRGVTFRNRIWVSPMCMYSCETGTGVPTDFHLVHQGAFSMRGAGLVITEASAVLPNGRISPEDVGIWNDTQAKAHKRIVDFHHSQGSLAGIQLAHAGRKASTYAPWLVDGLISEPPVRTDGQAVVPAEGGGWPDDVIGPSPIPFDEKHAVPKEMTIKQIEELTQAFVDAAKRSIAIGYDVIEIHGAHGYLQNNFVSPVSNQRTDQYGGSFENRVRFALETTRAVRAAIPESTPLFYRITADEWHEKGEKDEQGNYISWGVEQSRKLAALLRAEGVDLIDVSSGGNYSKQKIDVKPGYQVGFAQALKEDPALKGLTISAVGLITEPKQAEEILQKGESDVIFLAREFLRNADFVTRAAYEFETPVSVPVQYQRAHTRLFKHLQKKSSL